MRAMPSYRPSRSGSSELRAATSTTTLSIAPARSAGTRSSASETSSSNRCGLIRTAIAATSPAVAAARVLGGGGGRLRLRLRRRWRRRAAAARPAPPAAVRRGLRGSRARLRVGRGRAAGCRRSAGRARWAGAGCRSSARCWSVPASAAAPARLGARGVDGRRIGSWIGGRFNRSAGMSGGGTGGWPLISSGPLALPTRVAQPPLPSVAPMLHDTWWLPADQLGSEIVL